MHGTFEIKKEIRNGFDGALISLKSLRDFRSVELLFFINASSPHSYAYFGNFSFSFIAVIRFI